MFYNRGSKSEQLLILGLGLGLCLTPIHTAFAQDQTSSSESQIESQVESQDENVETSETSPSETPAEQSQPMLSFESFLPFCQYVEYVYQGDEQEIASYNMILEFAKDQNGLFQAVKFVGDKAQALIYQVTDQGLYQLATFDNYLNVEDLRYSDQVDPNRRSLILPRNIQIGVEFKSGYNQEINATIEDIIDEFYLGQVAYQNVVKVREADTSNPNQASLVKYYAPKAGLIAVQIVDQSGQAVTVLQLNSIDGEITY